jgi:hypothetical protein
MEHLDYDNFFRFDPVYQIMLVCEKIPLIRIYIVHCCDICSAFIVRFENVSI